MIEQLRGPGAPYHVLFDDDCTAGASLPDAFRSVYGSDWRLPPPGDMPYTFANFVVSRDGRISFNEPDYKGGNDISRGVAHDKWLMGLLRARADAVIIGTATLASAQQHRWTSAAVFRADATAFAALRAAEGRAPDPLLVIVTRSGELPADAVVLRKPRQPVLIATTAHGAREAQQRLDRNDALTYCVFDDEVPLAELVRILRDKHGVASLLCEGGAQLYGTMVAAGLIDDEFLTVSPVVAGNTNPPIAPRPGLVEGVAFDPRDPPFVDLLSVRRHESYLFQRSRYRRNA